jgi:hypothetical protein
VTGETGKQTKPAADTPRQHMGISVKCFFFEGGWGCKSFGSVLRSDFWILICFGFDHFHKEFKS